MNLPIDVFNGCIEDADEFYRLTAGIKKDPIAEMVKKSLAAKKPISRAAKMAGPVWSD